MRDELAVCVCYLPPHGSSRHVNASGFFEDLHTQIFGNQNECEFVIMGDFNSRIGEKEDFIAGVDDVAERQIIDVKENAYSDIFTEFLISANCVVLNGRGSGKNDYTFVSNRGCSVVDYAIVPHSLMPECNSFEVIRARELFTDAGCMGVIDPISGNLPDHSFLKWSINKQGTQQNTFHVCGEAEDSYIRYDVKDIPDTFMNDADITGI